MPAKQVLLHSMIILDVSEDWRGYLVYLEDEFSGLVSNRYPMQRTFYLFDRLTKAFSRTSKSLSSREISSQISRISGSCT